MAAICVMNLTGTAGVKQAFLSWTSSAQPCLSYLQHESTEIWESATNDRSAATLVDTVQGYSFTRGGLPDNVARYYWIRLVDASGQHSDWYPESATAGVSVTTLSSVSLAIILSSEAYVVRSDAQGAVSDWSGAKTTVKILDGTTDVTAQWTLAITPSSGVTALLSGALVSVTAMSVANGYVDITASKSGATSLTKRFSIAKTMDGQNGQAGYTAWLTKDSVVLQADENGVVADYSPATTAFKITQLSTDDTPNWSFQINQKSASITAVLNTNVLSVSGMSSDSGLVELVATKAGTSIFKTFTLVKARRGVTGTGTAGTRGSGRAYVSGRTSWSDSVAASAIQSAYGSGPIVGDEVSQYGAGFASTRRYDGTTWIVMGQVIDGNLLVTGTVTADSVVSSWVYAGGVNVGQLNAGTINTSHISIVGDLLGIGRVACVSTNDAAYAISAVNTVANGYAVKGWAYASGGTGVYGTGILHGVYGAGTSYGVVGNGGLFDVYAGGAGTNYGPFTGSHEVLIPNDMNFEPGDILCDVSVVNRRSISSAITTAAMAQQANIPAVGVATKRYEIDFDHIPAALLDVEGHPIPAVFEYQTTHDVAIVNGVGEGLINVCGEGGDITVGDLIVTSSIPGKGMRQNDDIVRGRTVAKSRENVTFSSQSEIKQIACIYLCG